MIRMSQAIDDPWMILFEKRQSLATEVVPFSEERVVG